MRQEKWIEFANEYVVSLFPVFMLPEGLWEGSKKLLKSPCYIAFKIENNAVTWYNQPRNWKKAHLKLVAKIKKNPLVLRAFYRRMTEWGKKQIGFCKSIKPKIKKASNQQLDNYYQRFVQYNTETYQYGLMIPLLDFQDTTFLSDELRSILGKYGERGLENLLTQPLLVTSVKKQDLELLKILALARKNRKTHRLFAKGNPTAILQALKTQDPRLLRKLKNHTEKFCWVYYVYEGPAADVVYFVELLKDLVKRQVWPARELAEYALERKVLVLRQQEAIERLDLTADEKQIVLLARDAVYYKALRRELQSRSYFLMEPLLKEIASRLNLSMKQVRMLLPDEISKALLKGEVNFDELNRRTKLVVYGRDPRRFIFSGEDASKYLKNYAVHPKLKVRLKELQGTVAYAGKAQGEVKIINSPEEMKKMRQGDVLVSQSTNPNLMPAIRLAGAIVTDEGGLTCHAAIVSRELKIPCVVGTKFASKALKDGERVKVDAVKGIISKLR